MLLEIASLEGRGSLCGISRHWGSQGKVDTTPVQTARREAAEAPVHWVMGNGSLRFWGPLAQMHRFLQDHQLLARLFGSLSCPPAVGRKGFSPVHSGEPWVSYVGSPTTFTGKAMSHPLGWQENYVIIPLRLLPGWQASWPGAIPGPDPRLEEAKTLLWVG